MTTDEKKILEKLGLSQNESKIYLTLLDLGPSVVTTIANTSKVHRTNVYDSLNKLTKKGLVSKTDQNNSTIYQATNPENLMSMVNEMKYEVEQILPSLKLRNNLIENSSKAAVHEGITTFTRMLLDLLDYQEPIYVYGIPKHAPDQMKHFMPQFHHKRLLLKTEMYHIYNHNAQKRIKELNSMEKTYARFLPQKFDSNVSTSICADLIIITVWADPVISIRIKNKTAADSYKKYFDLLWSRAN